MALLVRVVMVALCLLGMFAGAGQAYTPDRKPLTTVSKPGTIDWDAPHVPGQLLVALSDPETPVVQARLAAAGMPVIEAIPQLDLALVQVGRRRWPPGARTGSAGPGCRSGAGIGRKLERAELPLRAGFHAERSLLCVAPGVLSRPNRDACGVGQDHGSPGNHHRHPRYRHQHGAPRSERRHLDESGRDSRQRAGR